MNFDFAKTSLSLVALSAALGASPLATAAGNAPAAAQNATGAMSAQDRAAYSDRAQMKAWTADKEMLERALPPGHDKAFYVKALADRGYQITSVNVDRATAAEYEVVKGRSSYEVQLDFDKSGRATEVDVTTNAWRSDATSAAMKGNKVPLATRYEQGNERYSDRSRMKGWSDEKDRLEKALGVGHERAYYPQQLRSLGYQVTAVNDAEQDYAEYEIVRGNNSFEVQIDFDGGKAKELDVTTNAWKADATERALNGR